MQYPAALLFFISIYICIYVAPIQATKAQIILLNDLRERNAHSTRLFHHHEEEHLASTTRFETQKSLLRDDISKTLLDIASSQVILKQIQDLQHEVKQNTVLLEQKITQKQDASDKAREKEIKLQDVFVVLSTKSRTIMQEYEDNVIRLEQHEMQLTTCSAFIDNQNMKRKHLLKEQLISSLLWGHKLALLKSKRNKEAMKRVGIDIAISVALWGTGIGLVSTGAKISAGVAKWTYRIASSAQAPVTNLMSTNLPKRMLQVVELHVKNYETFLSQFTSEEVQQVLTSMQPDPVLNFEPSVWAHESPDNMALYELCCKRLENNLEQDLRSDYNEQAPILKNMIEAPPTE